MSSRNIWNNTSKNNIQTINKKNLKFILEGQTTTDDQLILKFISSSPIILKLHGYQNNDNINDSTYFKMMLDDTSFEYTTTYKNPIIDIVKDSLTVRGLTELTREGEVPVWGVKWPVASVRPKPFPTATYMSRTCI